MRVKGVPVIRKRSSTSYKNCILIADSYPPVVGSGAKRMAIISKYLSKLGWKVYVITVAKGYRNYLHNNMGFIHQDIKVFELPAIYPRILNEDSRKVSLLLKKLLRKILRKSTFPDYLLGWIPFAVIKSLILMKGKRVWIIYSSAPHMSSHVIALLLKRITGKPWVAEFRDPMVDSPDLFSNPLQKTFGLKLEEEILKQCDYLITVNEILKKRFYNTYPHNPQKFHIISNGFDPEMRSRISSSQRIRTRNVFKICYTGRFYPQRGCVPDFFLEAVSRLLKRRVIDPDKIDIQFYGGFPNKSRELVKIRPISQIVSVNGYIKLEESLRIQQESDFLLLFTGYQKGHEWETTAKIFEYLNSGKPILAMTCENSHAKEIIESTNTGKWVVGNSVDDIADAVLNYYNEFHSNHGYLNYSPNYEQIRKYDYSNLVSKLDRIMAGFLHNSDLGSSKVKVK